MGIKEKLSLYIENKKKQLQRGLEVSEQMKAEKERKRMLDGRHAELGTFKYGLMNRQNPIEFMKDVYEIRKAKRKN